MSIAGDADFYAWGLSDGKETGRRSNDVRAIGVQSFPFNATNQFIGFSVNTYDRWSNPSTNEFDIYVDVNNDGIDDYIVVGVDQGAVQTGTFNGRLGLVRLQHPKRRREHRLLRAGADGQRGGEHLRPLVAALPCQRACLNAANPRFTYHAVSFDVTQTNPADEVDGSAKYNAWSPAISTGGFRRSLRAVPLRRRSPSTQPSGRSRPRSA